MIPEVQRLKDVLKIAFSWYIWNIIKKHLEDVFYEDNSGRRISSNIMSFL